MKRIGTVVVLMCLVAAAADYQASIAFFSNLREVSISAPNRQNYILVDESLWQHGRPNLSDIRLYHGKTQVPYVLVEQRGGVSSEEQEARILNAGSVAGNTEFDLDLQSAPEYNRIRLKLDAKDFVATAQVEGRNELKQRPGTQLGKSTVYDFTREKLGANSVLTLPASSFRYLHVRISPGVQPKQVKGAFVSHLEEKQAAWSKAGSCVESQQSPAKTTLLSCAPAAAVPVDRILFRMASDGGNFRRSVNVQADGVEVARGELHRIHIMRAGQAVVSENLAVDVPGIRAKQLQVTVNNGDDAPLPLAGAQLLSVERRIYFDPAGESALKLYFGDPKLAAPSYNYAEFFHSDAAAVEARMGPDQHNPVYAGRPDERPWTERHQGVMWLAMLLAVVGLALLALRGFTKTAKAE